MIREHVTFYPHPLTPSPKMGEGALDCQLTPIPIIGIGDGGEEQ
jgi:hypothetical protein